MKLSAALGAITLVIAGLLSTQSALSAESCNTVFGEKKVLRSVDLTQATLETLVGRQISYKGKYVFRDPSDKRVVSGKGFVEAVALHANDQNPSFVIRLRQDNGDRLKVETFVADTTFELKIKSNSAMEAFVKSADADGLTLKPLKFHDSLIIRADFYRDPNNQKIRFAVVKPTNDPAKPFTIAQIDSISIKVPTDVEIAMSIVDQKPLALEVQTAEGRTEKIIYSDIVAIATQN